MYGTVCRCQSRECRASTARRYGEAVSGNASRCSTATLGDVAGFTDSKMLTRTCSYRQHIRKSFFTAVTIRIVAAERHPWSGECGSSVRRRGGRWRVEAGIKNPVTPRPTRTAPSPNSDAAPARSGPRTPDAVLPLFIAEMDYQLAPVVAEAMIDRIRASDVGYAGDSGGVGTAFAGFADRRWNWQVTAEDVTLTTDVSVVIVETLRAAIRPGDVVILMPPVYPPFFELIPEAGGTVVEVPLLDEPEWRIDLGGIERALRAGARAVLLCHPHNPVGLVHDAADLARLAELAASYGATIVSDEIHAPLVHPGVGFAPPFLTVSDAAREVGIAAHSASKAFNLAGGPSAR